MLFYSTVIERTGLVRNWFGSSVIASTGLTAASLTPFRLLKHCKSKTTAGFFLNTVVLSFFYISGQLTFSSLF